MPTLAPDPPQKLKGIGPIKISGLLMLIKIMLWSMYYRNKKLLIFIGKFAEVSKKLTLKNLIINSTYFLMFFISPWSVGGYNKIRNIGEENY